MLIKKIIIKENGKTTAEISFSDRLTVVEGSPAMCDIINLLQGKTQAAAYTQSVCFFAEVKIDKTYYIRGSKKKGDILFTVSVCSEDTECRDEYFEAVRQTEEMDSALFFHRFKRQDYPHRLFKYRDLLKYYPNGDFAALTNGYGTTRSFRGFMAQYIKHFKPIKLREDKDFFLKLSDSGEFNVGRLGSDERVFLSESENTLYHYLSFISIADFWDRAEKIRNMNCIKKPLVISSFLERLDSSIDVTEILRRTNTLPRQTIMFAQKELDYGK